MGKPRVRALVHVSRSAFTRLPERFRYTFHNLVAHPLTEVLFQVGLKKTGDVVHIMTTPYEKDKAPEKTPRQF